MSKNKKMNVRSFVFAGLFVALGVLIPMAFHYIPNGRMLSPMHIPVFMAGLVFGPQLGLLVGILTPLLSSILTGMPPIFPMAVSMALELGVYGLVAGFVFTKFLKDKNITDIIKMYISLIVAQIIGRIVAGIFMAIVLTATGEGYGFQAFLASYIISALPAILLQLVVIPPLSLATIKAIDKISSR